MLRHVPLIGFMFCAFLILSAPMLRVTQAVLMLLSPETVMAEANSDKNRDSVVKCDKPSAKYLKEAEKLQKKLSKYNHNSTRASRISMSLLATLELYEICSELERNNR